MSDLITATNRGLYCAAGDFWIDPVRPVARAVVTHAHADHARPGHGQYYCASPSIPLLERRLPEGAAIRGVDFGETIAFGPTSVSLHPAGHILGSAQVRVAHRDEVWVASGDYKRDADPSCEPFEVVPCDTFITEATFALPVYRWTSSADVADAIHRWWQGNAESGRASILYCYAVGKAQRVLAALARCTDRPVLVHGAVDKFLPVYRAAGIEMLPTERLADQPRDRDFRDALVIAPPSAHRSRWGRRLGESTNAFASGWMRVRGVRRRRAHDRGFVLSDHADWPGLIRTIEETGARRVLATHGYSDILARYCRDRGLEAGTIDLPRGGEDADA